MSKGLRLAAVLVATMVALSPTTTRAQAPGRITVAWESASLPGVVAAIAQFSGKRIVIAPDTPDVRVTVEFRNTLWESVLKTILDQHALVSRVDADGVIRIERRLPAPVRSRAAE
jgi:ferric-dicitrate binding protein FerR (iron transport regulator)